MNMKDKLLSLSEYSIGFNIYDGNFVINITYPNGWTVVDNNDKDIQFARDGSRPNLYYYIAPISVNVERIFEMIDDVITYNVELEEKVKLFQIKVAELKALFTEESIETLNTLEFKVKRKKVKKVVETVQTNELETKESMVMSYDVKEETYGEDSVI